MWWLTVGCDRRERLGQVADARLVVGLRLDQADDPKACRVGERLERTREIPRLFTFQRAGEERWARDRHGCDRLHQIDIDMHL